jgi:hypothetical protein
VKKIIAGLCLIFFCSTLLTVSANAIPLGVSKCVAKFESCMDEQTIGTYQAVRDSLSCLWTIVKYSSFGYTLYRIGKGVNKLISSIAQIDHNINLLAADVLADRRQVGGLHSALILAGVIH